MWRIRKSLPQREARASWFVYEKRCDERWLFVSLAVNWLLCSRGNRRGVHRATELRPGRTHWAVKADGTWPDKAEQPKDQPARPRTPGASTKLLQGGQIRTWTPELAMSLPPGMHEPPALNYS
jgi:hypothetical protein